MGRVTITKVEHDERGYWTARVSDGIDTITVDNRIGPWTTPVDAAGLPDPHADHGSNQLRRREVFPEISARLRSRMRAVLRGEAQDESPVEMLQREPPANAKDAGRPRTPQAAHSEPSSTESIAQRMAEAALAAVKEAA